METEQNSLFFVTTQKFLSLPMIMKGCLRQTSVAQASPKDIHNPSEDARRHLQKQRSHVLQRFCSTFDSLGCTRASWQ